MLKQIIFTSLLFLSLLTLTSCISGKKNKSQDFENAVVYPVVKCIADTNVSYALFLPFSYDKTKPCPLLLLFDPHGDGLLPVNIFSTEAAKSGFILVGSNNSKNGMDFEQTASVYRKMLADISVRLNIEKKAIYVGGFSGGSRVAGALAVTEGGIAGVIGCGAGLPDISRKPVSLFSYLAVAGNQDFNYSEIQKLDESLEAAGYQHHMLVFDGIHQWPPKELLPDIFTWLRFDCMRQQAIPADRTEINRFIENNDKIAGALASKGQFPGQQEVYSKMLHYLQGLTDVSPLQSEIKKLSADKAVIAYKKQQKQLLDMEKELQQKFAPEFQSQNMEWWANEVSRLRSYSEQAAAPEKKLVYQRVLGFLSINSYMYSTNALKQGDLASAERFIGIYMLVDPPNAEHRYMAAKLAALKNNPDAVFNALNQAFGLGFKDISRLKADADFKPYQEDERFKSLLNTK